MPRNEDLVPLISKMDRPTFMAHIQNLRDIRARPAVTNKARPKRAKKRTIDKVATKIAGLTEEEKATLIAQLESRF